MAPLRVRDRQRSATSRARTPPDWLVALLLGLAVFGLYCSTMGNLTGYEPQTAGAAEGLVILRAPRLVPGSPIWAGQSDYGRLYSHAGLTQPLLEAPVYYVGLRIDDAVSGGRGYRWRNALLRFYNPLMATITVLAAFLLLRLRGRSQARALAVAAMVAAGTMTWPYSKIGMETTMMAMVSLMILGTAWATTRGGVYRFALTGVSAGAVAASKPIGMIMLAGLLAFTSPMLAFPRRERIRYLIALAVPILAWLAAIAWYNDYRTGSIANFDQNFASDWANAPVALVGMLVSPGKGLFWYSPLVILGALGMRPLWRQDRPLALAVAITFGVNLVVLSGTRYWSEETWGPRYIAATSWLLVLPIAWWAYGRTRLRIVAVTAVVALVVQFAGVFAWYGVSVPIQRALSGQPTYLYPDYAQAAVAYGDDAPAWIPGVSELRMQVELVAAWAKEEITGTGFKVSYEPYWGRARTMDFTHPSRRLGKLPDFWWDFRPRSTSLVVLAVTMGVLMIAASLTLLWLHPPAQYRRRSASPAMSG